MSVRFSAFWESVLFPTNSGHVNVVMVAHMCCRSSFIYWQLGFSTGRESWRDIPSLWVSVLGQDPKKNFRSSLWQKWVNWRNNRKKPSIKGEVGQDKKGIGTGMMRYGVFKTGHLDIHLGGRRLTVLIDICKLHNNNYVMEQLCSIEPVFPIIQSVVIRCMFVCIE